MQCKWVGLFGVLSLACWLAYFFPAAVQAHPLASVLQPASAHAALPALAGRQSGPMLWISNDLTTTTGSAVVVPVNYQSDGVAITATSFSLDLDQRCLTFDARDGDQNGQPDAMTFYTPPGLSVLVMVDLTDEDGEIDVLISDFAPPFVTLPDRSPLLTLVLSAQCQPAPGATTRAAVAFSPDPEPSFGSPNGASIAGSAVAGWITIVNPVPTVTPTPTVTVVPATTPTLIATRPTAAPTPTPTPLAVTIVDYFTATPTDRGIHLQWRTAHEINTRGFVVYRKQIDGAERNGDFLPISPLLPAQVEQGGAYTFADMTATPNVRYLYLLVEEKQNGARTEFIHLLIISRLGEQQPYLCWLPIVAQH